MSDISGFGARGSLIASNTFPTALSLSEFSDDTDAFDSGNIDIGGAAMGMNGDLVTWSHATPVPLVLSFVPNSTDDQNMQILANANRVAKGKLGANDVISVNIVYPDGTTKQFTGGKLIGAAFANSVTSAGRMKTKTYSFLFEQVI